MSYIHKLHIINTATRYKNAEIVQIIYKYKILTYIQVKESILPNKYTRRQLHPYEIQIVEIINSLRSGIIMPLFTHVDIEQEHGHDVRTVCLEHTVLFLPFLAG